MEILKYECVKLRKKKLFWALSLVLLAANLLTIFMYEKNTPAYFYVYAHRASYQQFQLGDADADINGYYQQDLDNQTSYIESYEVFAGEMEARAEQMGQVLLYGDSGSYTYRNLIKTCSDFAPFVGLALKADNCFGIRELANYSTGILFLLIFLALLSYFVLFYERDMNLVLLLKGSRLGHAPLAAAKLIFMLLAAVLYTLVQESSAILFFGRMYGYGSLSRVIQSVSLFRNCYYPLTVGSALVCIVLIRIAVALFLTCILFCIGMLMKNETTAIAVTAAGCGIEYLFSQVLSISGSQAALKCINPFYCWNMRLVLGEYQNLNLFGYPAGKNICALIAAALLAVLLSAVGVFAFHKTCQIKTESRLDRLLLWLRSRLHFLTRRTSLTYFEFFKTMVQQKKGIVFLLLLMWCVYSTIGVFGPRYYASAREAAYHLYASQLNGPVTEETLSFMEEEEARIDAMWQQVLAYGSNPTGADYLNKMIQQAELDRIEDGFYQMQAQLTALQEKPGDLLGKYVVDELFYSTLWNDYKTDILLWFAGAVSILFFTAGLYPMDEKRRMLPLLRTTRHGRRHLDRSKNRCAYLCTSLIFFIFELPLLLEYYRIDHFSVVMQRLCDFTGVSFSSRMPLWAMLAMVFLLKGLSFLAVCLATLRLSKITKNEILTILAGTGVTGMIAVVFYHFGLDINLLLIRIL